jgi:hypothetical protein
VSWRGARTHLGGNTPARPNPGRAASGLDRCQSYNLLQVKNKKPAREAGFLGAPRGIRTPDTRFRRPMLYPLSYGCFTQIISPASTKLDPPQAFGEKTSRERM